MSDGVAKWLANGRAGASSQALAAASLGAVPNVPDYPHDPSDFGRCLALWEMAPEAVEGLKRLAAVSGPWNRLAERWADLIELYQRGESSACFHLMQRLINPSNLRAYEIRKGDDGRVDLYPWSPT